MTKHEAQALAEKFLETAKQGELQAQTVMELETGKAASPAVGRVMNTAIEQAGRCIVERHEMWQSDKSAMLHATGFVDGYVAAALARHRIDVLTGEEENPSKKPRQGSNGDFLRGLGL